MAETVKAGRENWVEAEGVAHCSVCKVEFGWSTWKHHCRACGQVVCWKCSDRKIEYTPQTRRGENGYTEKPKRVCDKCFEGIIECRTRAEVAKKEALALREDIRACVKVSLDEIADFQAELQEQRGGDVELDEAIQHHRERKWNPFADESANMKCEWHKIHTFHEPLEDLHQFMYRDRTSDIIVHSWGKTKADAFAEVSMGLLQYMAELLRRAAREATTTCQELEEFLFIFCYEAHVARDVEIVPFDEGALQASAGRRGAGNAIAVRGSGPGGAAKARTEHLIRRADWRQQEEVTKKFSVGATDELASKLQRRQDKISVEVKRWSYPAAQAKGECRGHDAAVQRSASPSFCDEHTADIVVHCWGKSRANAFAQLSVGVFQYMAKYDQGAGFLSRASSIEGHDLLRLLHEILEEFLHIFRIEGMQLSPHTDLVDGEASAARAKKQSGDDVPTQHMRGASSELAYALKKRQYAVAGQRLMVPRGEKPALPPPPAPAWAAPPASKLKESLKVELEDRVQGKPRQAVEVSKTAEGKKRKKRQPQPQNAVAAS